MSDKIKEYKIFFRSEIYINARNKEQAEDILRGLDDATLAKQSNFFDIESVEKTGVTFEKTVYDDEVDELVEAFETVTASPVLMTSFLNEYGTDIEVVKFLIKSQIIKESAKNLIFKLVKATKI